MDLTNKERQARFNPYFHGIYKRGYTTDNQQYTRNKVSILIFMESTKEVSFFDLQQIGISCFNPYFHGIYKRGNGGLNLTNCILSVSILIFMESTKEVREQSSINSRLWVSILIFMESTKEAKSYNLMQRLEACFNPYFHGIYKRGETVFKPMK